MSAVATAVIKAKVSWIATQTSVAPERWMGVCEQLNIATEGDSLDDLHSLIPESIHLLMTDLVQDNEFDAFLREKGWQHTWDGPQTEAGPAFNLPWQMIVEGSSGFERSAG